jgi:hypothetical protein
MQYKYDIYETSELTKLKFIESVNSMLRAEQRVLELAAKQPGKRFFIKPEYDLPEAAQ